MGARGKYHSLRICAIALVSFRVSFRFVSSFSQRECIHRLHQQFDRNEMASDAGLPMIKNVTSHSSSTYVLWNGLCAPICRSSTWKSTLLLLILFFRNCITVMFPSSHTLYTRHKNTQPFHSYLTYWRWQLEIQWNCQRIWPGVWGWELEIQWNCQRIWPGVWGWELEI